MSLNKKIYRCRRSVQSGFTLIEVMVVVVIIAILAAILVPKIMQRPGQAKEVAAKQDILALENALDLYNLDNGMYPTTDQGLNALVKKPESDPIPSNWSTGGYLKTLPNDPWGNAYRYENPGQHGEVDIYSMGPNNSEESEIGNWSAVSADDATTQE